MKISLIIILFMIVTSSANAYTYLGAQYETLQSQSRLIPLDDHKATTQSYFIGKRLSNMFGVELIYSNYSFNETVSQDLPEIGSSTLNITNYKAGLRIFFRRITYGIGYDFKSVTREIVQISSTERDLSLLAYDKNHHGLYFTAGVRFNLLYFVDFYFDTTMTSNKDFHTFGLAAGLRLYPFGF